MKILVVSLLRLGDLIMQQPLLQMLRLKYPEAEIHLLINRQFASSKYLVDNYVDQFHFFDRELYQRAMGNIEYNILYPYQHLNDSVQKLKKEKFDLAINFTHNRLSAYLCGLIDAKEFKGAYYKQGKFVGINNRWMHYFDSRFSKNGRSIFHYVEVLASSFEFPIPPRVYPLSLENKKNIYIQPLTSDRKKNWNIASYQSLLQQLKKKYSAFNFKILCAPFEQNLIEKYFSKDDILVLQLVELPELLKNARALITGDTSIMHLAAQNGVPVLEIAIGSADVCKTGPYSYAFRAIESQISCYPCQHSESCFQVSHFCAHELTVSEILNEFQLLLDENYHQDSVELKNEKEIWQAYLNYKPCPQNLLNQEHTLQIYKYTQVLGDLLRQDNFGPEQAQQIVQLIRIIKSDKQDISFIFNPLEIIQHTNYPNLESLAIHLKKATLEITDQVVYRQNNIEVEYAERN